MAPLPTPPALPIPLGVRTDTGEPCPPLSPDTIEHLYPDIPDAAVRSNNRTTLGPDSSVDDPNDLTQTGWGILFASDADPAVQAQLQPLIDLRRKQVQDPNLFKIFAGPDPLTGGVLPNQTAADWAYRHGVSITAPVDPLKVPYYLLIVGSPERIPFEFQANLKLQWLVGRLYFDDLADYGRYATQVVAYESAPWQAPAQKNSAVWVTRNPGDVATAMLSGAITGNFRDGTPQLGAGRPGFTLDCFSDVAATKPQLAEILRGKLPHGKPQVIFTGSHGCECPITDPAFQRENQGALLTQEWTRGAVTSAVQFTAADIPADHQLSGTILFLFACFSAGCPATDSYYFNPNGSPKALAPTPLIARLPQALLAGGALAVIGHIDRAFPYGFVDGYGTPQVQLIRTPLERLMQGRRAGLAADALTMAWSSMAAQIALAATPPLSASATAAATSSTAAPVVAPTPPPTFAASANAHIARDDARNYIVLGDPAVQLRMKDPDQL